MTRKAGIGVTLEIRKSESGIYAVPFGLICGVLSLPFADITEVLNYCKQNSKNV